MELLKKILWWGIVVFLGFVIIGLLAFTSMSFPELADMIIEQDPVQEFPAARRYHQALNDAIMTIEANFGYLKAIGATIEAPMTGEAGLTLPSDGETPSPFDDRSLPAFSQGRVIEL